MNWILLAQLLLSAILVGSLLLLSYQMRRWFAFRFYGPWLSHFHSRQAYRLEGMLSGLEDKFNLRLSWAARQMLLLPVLETLEDREPVSFDEVEESLTIILGTAAEEPSRTGREGRRLRARSIIRAFHLRFCNIPPFCSRREERGA